MSDPISRRAALKNLAIAAGVLAVPALQKVRVAQAAELPHVAATDPTAVALAYHEDATKVEAAKFPTYKAGQKCSTCAQLQGAPSAAWRPCTLFPQKLVSANGWCRVWVQKSA
ncbi:MAG: high-potential iron-sulfur protein [Steroidobacteraceae bacterium]